MNTNQRILGMTDQTVTYLVKDYRNGGRYIPHTIKGIDFWYMIKNKEATDSAALEFCHILNKFAAQLDDCLSFKDFCLKQNSKASYRRKLGGSAICSKYEQNSTASRSVAYLFFIIYSNSTVGQLQIKIS